MVSKCRLHLSKQDSPTLKTIHFTQGNTVYGFGAWYYSKFFTIITVHDSR